MTKPGFTLALMGLVAGLSSSALMAAPRAVLRKAPFKAPFGILPDGRKVDLYTLTNSHGSQVKITNYGGKLVSIKVPDSKGHIGDVLLGFDNISGYLKDDSYQGSLIGRYANRIAKGRFTLDGKPYKLAVNNGVNHLHGGIRGFDKQVWTAHPLHMGGTVGLELRYFSRAGEEGYPGNLTTRVIYTFDNQNRLRIVFRAVTDRDTVVNFTNHAYFNLGGAGTGTILNHRLQIAADRFTPIDPTSIPFGPLQKVAGTPFDFRRSHVIGARIGVKDTQLANGQGYDHNFVLNHPVGKLSFAAQATDPKSGRVLTVSTTQPGVQFYSGNFLSGAKGKDGRTYPRRSGFCLEAQHFPDSPNEPTYPSTVLHPGQTYRQTIIYQFSTR